MGKVYLVEHAREDPPQRTEAAVGALWDAAGLAAAFRDKDLAAIKLHVGEKPTDTILRPPLVAALVRRVASTGARPFLTDTAVLYRSPRDNAVGHALVAHHHGFTVDAVGAPFVCADGLHGADEVEVPLRDGSHHQTVAVAAAIVQARSMLVLSHATGHLVTGMGAALKNLGMGCASKKGKLRMHHGQVPGIDAEDCVGCGECQRWCPSGAITIRDATAAIDPAVCIGCGECVAVCREGAVTFGWGIQDRELQRRVVDHAAAVVRGKPGRLAFVTAATGITPDCDCMGRVQTPVVPDIGLLASTDPVAIDAAVHDLVRERSGGRTLESLSYPRLDATEQLACGERLGLGSRDYELIRVEP